MERFNHSLREMSCMMITLQQENAQLKHQLAGTQQMVEDLQRQLEESRWRCYYLEHSVNSPAEEVHDDCIHISADDLSKLLATF